MIVKVASEEIMRKMRGFLKIVKSHITSTKFRVSIKLQV
jgi:hypothetical protein